MNAEQETGGQKIARSLAETLVKMMQMALGSGAKGQAEIVAAEAVTSAELKDHMNRELIGEIAKKMDGNDAAVLKKAYDEVEDQKDRHFYHSRGWAREPWAASLGIPAVIPPPEDKMYMRSAAGAAVAQASRKLMLKRRKRRDLSVRSRCGRAAPLRRAVFILAPLHHPLKSLRYYRRSTAAFW